MNTIRYTLSSSSQGTKLLYTQPKGWNDDVRSLKRSTDMFGILYDHLEDIEFTRDGYDFITSTERVEGFDAKIILRREVRNQSDVWELDYQGELDLTTKQQTKNGVKVSILQGGLSEELKAINSDKYELSRNTSVDGNDIGELTYDLGQINGRDLLVTSLLEDTEEKTIQGTRTIVGGTSENIEYYYVPRLTKVFSGDEEIIGVQSTPLKPFETNSQFRPVLNSTHSFTDRYSGFATKNLTIKVDVTIEIPFGNGAIDLILYTYKPDVNGDLVYSSAITLLQNNSPSQFTTIDQTFTQILNLEPDDYISLVFYIRGDFQTGSTLIWEMEQRTISIDSFENSQKEPTAFTGLTIKKAYQRLSKIATGTDKLKTDYFTNGDFKDAIVTNGKRIRNFDDSIELSLKQLNDSCRAMFNTSMGVEVINNVERFVIEPYEYFFNPSLLLELGEVTDVQESYNDKFLASKIDVGYKKGGDYEEQQGLDEYNTQSSFSHNFKKVDSDLDLQSDLRADTIGIELTRRKQRVDFPTEDTRYDKDNFIIDCYKQSNLYINRPYTLDFATLPQGIFSPETAYNLRLTPKNNLYRISRSFAWLAPYRNKITNFISGGRNTNLITRLIGGVDREENTNIDNDSLNVPLLQPIQVTFKHRLTTEQFKILKGNTNGVPNWYKLLSYIDDRGELNYGFILEYEPKDEGTMTLIKANI